MIALEYQTVPNQIITQFPHLHLDDKAMALDYNKYLTGKKKEQWRHDCWHLSRIQKVPNCTVLVYFLLFTSMYSVNTKKDSFA